MKLKYVRKRRKFTILLIVILLSQQLLLLLNTTDAAIQESDLLLVDTTQETDTSTCFPVGTRIVMADGSYKNIEDIAISDKLLSFDICNNTLVVGIVTKIYKHFPDESRGYYIFSTEDGEQLRATPEHVLFVNKRWMPAYKVKISDSLKTVNGGETKVYSIQYVSEKTWAYNLEVQPFNTFFAEGILVHNAKAPSEPYVPPPDIIIPDNITVLCCLPAGTQILLEDKSTKSIEDIKVGDKILSYDTEKQDFVYSKVTKKIIKIREGVYDINHGLIKITDDHPLYVRKKNGTLCWAAINPRKSKLAYSFRKPMPLEIGDKLFTSDGRWIKIESITFKLGPIKTYTFAVDSVFHNYFANNVLVSNSLDLIICGGGDEDDDIDHYDVIDDDGDDDHPPVEIIKISVSPNPPVERANITIDAPTADTVTVQLVEKKFDMAGVYLYSEKIDSYKWRCFIPSNSADKFVYIQASNLEGAKGIYWSQAILENQTPTQKFELILDTDLSDQALNVFKLDPDPVEFLTPTDGRVHAVYEGGTVVYITAQNYEDYVFEYWTGTGIEDTSLYNPLETIMNQNKEYVAHYEEKIEQPNLSFNPTYHNFGSIGEGKTASATFEIWNSGTGTLEYSLSESAGWLSVSPSDGNSTGEHDSITFSVDTTGLSVGSYSADIVIDSNGGSGSFSVSLDVVNEPVLSFNPTSHDFGNIGIGGCKKTSFYIWNSQENTILEYKINITGLEDYVEVEPDSGSCEYTSPPQNISFTLCVKNLPPGYYEGSFLIESNGGVGTFSFNFTVVDVPSLGYYPNKLNVTCGIGKTVNENLSISNGGAGVLYYNLSTDSSWLSVTPSKGRSSGETDKVVVTIDASSLDAGKYFGNVYINCSNGENATIPVNLTVVANSSLGFSPSSIVLHGRKGDIITSSFKIKNRGIGSLQYTLTPDKSWIRLSNYSGYSSGEKDEIQITINTTLLNPGIYHGNISIDCDNGDTGTIEITLYLNPSQTEKSIEIITPNGGENWQIGGVYEIRWTSIGNVGEKVKIELYRGDNLFKVLSTNISNVGNCRWVISTDIPPGYEY
ncbi:hypothetical protein DRN38_04820, partial [Thermococci archaeon]